MKDVSKLPDESYTVNPIQAGPPKKNGYGKSCHQVKLQNSMKQKNLKTMVANLIQLSLMDGCKSEY